MEQRTEGAGRMAMLCVYKESMMPQRSRLRLCNAMQIRVGGMLKKSWATAVMDHELGSLLSSVFF